MITPVAVRPSNTQAQSDGTINIGDSWPCVFLPDEEAWVSEDVVVVESVCAVCA